MRKASVAIAMIAKNAAKTIGACLDSIVPYVEQVVVCVDANTTDATASIAKKHGALVFKGLNVSLPHECPYHGQILAQHFARARNESFSHLRRDVEWHGWFDSDDVVRGGDRLAEYLEQLPDDVQCVWLPYHYAQVGQGGPTSTLFDRERFVRVRDPWEWQYRVHEVLVPSGSRIEHVTNTRTDAIAVHHQGEGHDTTGAARRNIRLLEIDLEENPNDMRALFYMGNQYFALQKWDVAIEFYSRSVQAENPYQVWQTWIYLSMAHEKAGNIGESLEAAFHALDVAPYHPEPYYRLAILAMMTGDMQKCEFWTRLGDSMPEAPFFAFKNPLDRPFNARLTLGQAYANAGYIAKARRQLEIAARTLPEPNILEGIEQHRKLEEESAIADSWVRVLSQSPELIAGRQMPGSVWKFGRVRDVVVPGMLAARGNTQPRIVFWCGRSVEPWAPPSIDTTGIGGSETAVIQIARRFAADGWRVDVYNDPDFMEGEYDGVGYWGLNRLKEGERAEVYVAWRSPGAAELPLERRLSLLWCHDLNSGPGASDKMAQWDRVLGVSRWHGNYLSQLYGGLTNTGYVPNGIDLDRFSEPVRKVPFRCVYGSSQDRGLLELLKLWPAISAVEPAAELHIAYGWENFDKWIAMGNKSLADLKAAILPLLDQKGVVWRGRLPQDQLAKLYQESYVWPYPTTFLEVSCITAMEVMAAGCVPVTSAAGALPETIGDAGLVVPGNAYSWAWQEFWISCLKSALLNPETRLALAARGKERAKGLSWDKSYERWKEIVVPMLEGEKEAVLA